MREDSRRGTPGPARTGRTGNGRDPRFRGSARRGTAPMAPGWAADGAGAAEAARLTTLIEPVVRAMDVDLESVRLSPAGRRRVLRIVVDADGGITLDDIAEISREVSARLDARNAMGEAPYTLEVSSPGVDRPLTQPRHWRRAAGRLVTVALAAGDQGLQRHRDDGPAHIEGRVMAADDQGVTLEIDGTRRTFGYADLGPGRVQVEFGRLGEPGGLGGDAADEEDRNGH